MKIKVIEVKLHEVELPDGVEVVNNQDFLKQATENSVPVEGDFWLVGTEKV